MLEKTDQIALIRRTETYLTRIFGSIMSIQGSTADRRLPFHLSDQYGFFEGHLANQPCLFLVLRGGQAAPPASLEKQFKTIHSDYPGWALLLVLPALDSRTRARLIAHRIPFVVPDLQLHAPELAIDLRERLAAPVSVPKHLSPSAQLLVLAHLLQQDVQEELSSRLSIRLHFTPMSMSRAFAEVNALDLVNIQPVGTERRLTFKLHGRALWEKVLPFLRSPVRKRRGVPEIPPEFPGLLAGEAALSHYTMLAEPRVKSFAVPASQWKMLEREYKLYYSDTLLKEDHIIETWSYDPTALSQSSVVDPLSLILSIRDNADERASIEADHLLEQILQ